MERIFGDADKSYNEHGGGLVVKRSPMQTAVRHCLQNILRYIET